LGIAWTLVHEALFYLYFALLLFWRSVGSVIMALWFSLCAIAAYTQGHWLIVSVWYEIIVHPFNLWFLCGMVGYGLSELLKQFVKSGVRGAMHIAALAALLLTHVCLISSVLKQTEYELVSAGIFLLYFGRLGIVACQRWLKRYPSLMLLGDASYSIYLVHTPIMAILYAVIVRTLKLPVGDYSYALFMVLFVSALICGVWFYRRVEVPLLNWVRMLLSDHSHGSRPIPPVRARA
jgi:peptidoglycan/LPS O-acetylase OafA/YrhL